MKLAWPFTIGLLAGLMLLTISAEGKDLKGQVLLVRDGGNYEPASPAQVSIVSIGNPDVTKKDGGFRLFLPDIYRSDDRITLYVEFKNNSWVMSEPIGGEFRLPENLNQAFVKILLVPKGAPELHSEAQIANAMEMTLEESLTQVTQDGKPADFDPYVFARERARKTGVLESAMLEGIQKLSDQYAQSDDPKKQGIAAIFNKQLDQAAEFFRKAVKQKELTRKELLREIARLKNAQGRKRSTLPFSKIYAVRWDIQGRELIRKTSREDNERELNALEQQLRWVTEEIVEDLRKVGSAFYTNYKFEQALETYQKAFTFVTKDSNPTVWASLLINLGKVNRQIAIRTEGKKIDAHLQRSIWAYQQAQEVYTRDTLPQDWAMTQVNLGIVLSDQGRRATTGADSQRLLAEAVTAYRAALEVYTRATLPQDWAMAQVNLGLALWDQGTRATGADSQRLLAEAVIAYRAALEVFAHDTLPQDWAMTQISLGIALSNQGARATGADSQRLLAEAVMAYRAALEVYTRATLPQNWAMTQVNLGLALSDQGTRAIGADSQCLLAEAVMAYRAALEVYTRATLPPDWAATQVNLGLALSNQGARATGADSQRLLAEAVTAYRAALEVYTRATLPQNWAMTLMSLGSALSNQGARATGADSQRLLAEAVIAYRAVFEVFTREGFPSYWSIARSNFIETQFLLGEWQSVQQDVALLLRDPFITDDSKVALQILLILALIGEGEWDPVPAALDHLRARIASQSPGFLMTWNFQAIKQFLQSEPRFASSRDWALNLIQAVEQHGRENILEKLDTAIAQYSEAHKQ